MTTTTAPPKSRRFSFLSFSSLGKASDRDRDQNRYGDPDRAPPAIHDTQIFPRLKASISPARRRWSDGRNVVSPSGTGKAKRSRGRPGDVKHPSGMSRSHTLGSISVPAPLHAYRRAQKEHARDDSDHRRCVSMDATPTPNPRVGPSDDARCAKRRSEPFPNAPFGQTVYPHDTRLMGQRPTRPAHAQAAHLHSSEPRSSRDTHSRASSRSQNDLAGFDAWIAEQRSLVARRRPAFDPEALFAPPAASNNSHVGGSRTQGHARRHSHGGNLTRSHETRCLSESTMNILIEADAIPRKLEAERANRGLHALPRRRSYTGDADSAFPPTHDQDERWKPLPIGKSGDTSQQREGVSYSTQDERPVTVNADDRERLANSEVVGRRREVEPEPQENEPEPQENDSEPEVNDDEDDGIDFTNPGWKEQVTRTVEFWGRAAYGGPDTQTHNESWVAATTAHAMAYAAAGSRTSLDNNYPVAECPDKVPECHLHRSAAGVELHHHLADHVQFERQRRKKPDSVTTCWNRNHVVLDREREKKASRINKAWKESFGLKGSWVEGKKFADLYGKRSKASQRTASSASVAHEGMEEFGALGASNGGTTSKTTGSRSPPISVTRGHAKRHSIHTPVTTTFDPPVCPGAPRAKKHANDAEDLPHYLARTEVNDPVSPTEAYSPAKPSASGPPPLSPVEESRTPTSWIDKVTTRRKRFSAPPDPVTDPIEDNSRPPTPPPKDAPTQKAKGKGRPQLYESVDPQGTIRKYLGMDAAEMSAAVNNAARLIRVAGNVTSEDGHLLDSGSVSSYRTLLVVDTIPDEMPDSLHIVLSAPSEGDDELFLNLRGTKYALPALTVRGVRVIQEDAYWDVLRRAHTVDIIGDVPNLVALAKWLQAVDTVRLVLRGNTVPWSLHIRCKTLVTFTHVPWSVAKRKLDNDFRPEDKCLVQVGPVPNGIVRLVLHVVYDDRSPGMTVARVVRLPTPASLEHVVIVFQRERQAAMPGLSAAKVRLHRSPVLESLAQALLEVFERSPSAAGPAFTLVGLEMMAGNACNVTHRMLVKYLSGQGIDTAVAAARISVLSHAEYAAEVGNEQYVLETSVSV